MKTTVTARGQTVVPAKIRKDHQIGSQTQLEWMVVLENNNEHLTPRAC
jgi:bifunctional DNA-binding transcriptional regulator/antitoxin component of YhaV-PrlF toxin-antitoxin module